AINSEKDLRLNSAEILGVDSTFGLFASAAIPSIDIDEAYVSENTAQRLKLEIGDEILLRIKNVDVIPVNAPFAQDKQASVSFRVVVSKILTDSELARFSLKSDQKAPYNIFISKEQLARKMELKNKSNLLLVEDTQNTLSKNDLNNALARVWHLADAGLIAKYDERDQNIELTSERVFIDHSIAQNIKTKFTANGSLSYLVNAIKSGSKVTPYSFVSGLSSNVLTSNIANNEIILNDWCATDLGLGLGDSLVLEYYVIGPYRELGVKQKLFVVKSIQKNQGELFNASLTPDFPGLSEAESCSDWDTGVPIDLEKIRDKDEDFWDDFKGTPKAIISLESAQSMWGNPYGSYTSMKISETVSIDSVFACINPSGIGLQFIEVRKEGSLAAQNSISFSELFISLSFFVIAAAVLLLILIYTLNIISRKTEIGVLNALGFTHKKIKNLFIKESLVSIAVGSISGVFFGILYNALVLNALNTLWNDAVRTHALEIYISPSTLIMGGLMGMLISLTSVYFVVRRQLKLQITQALKKQNDSKLNVGRNKIIAYGSLIIGIAVLLSSLFSKSAINAEMFLTAGGLILIALVAFANLVLKKQLIQFETHSFGIFKLAVKNLSRQRVRSIMAILLLGLGTFSVIITGANRKTFYGSEQQRESGTGGFLYWVENSIPIIHNLNTPEGQRQFNIADEPITDSIHFIQLLSLEGNDASCLNLNQVQKPRILGLNTLEFETYKPFSITSFIEGIDAEKPWLELEKQYAEGVIPAYVDQTVITWGLLKKVGDTLIYNDEKGNKLYVVIAGGLQSSVFQGNILISDKNLRKYFPSVAGSKVMLIDAKPENKEALKDLLGFYFADYGVDFELASTRLATFNSITNTYLDVFMLLGGLGVAIGTLGFGIILLRNKIERKNELALLAAIGFKKFEISKLLFAEHMILLVSGMLIGIISALVGILPSFLSTTLTIPSAFVLLLIAIIFGAGLIAIWLTSGISRQKTLISALRKE
ncbi:MAG: FtsX-like permease family protein, partial [Salinivirgaceae bacterium]|nr:FtsX-like permease family protein [Salinivirgaceae bacterium]